MPKLPKQTSFTDRQVMLIEKMKMSSQEQLPIDKYVANSDAINSSMEK